MGTLNSYVRLLSFAAVLVIGAPLACGGKATEGGGGTGGGGGAGGSAGAKGGSGGSGGSGGATGGSGGSGGAIGGSGGAGGSTSAHCVDISLSDYDTSCSRSSDCATNTAGTLCTGSCECGGAAINVSGLSQYNAAIAPITQGLCGCPFSGSPTCVSGTCRLCADPTTPGCAHPTPKPPDAGVDSSPAASFACTYEVAGTSYCYEYTGISSTTYAALKSACASQPGSKEGVTCPTTGLAGCCEDIPSSGSSITYGYCTYGVPMSSIASLESACASVKGTWTM
jgi:hypothetical protein